MAHCDSACGVLECRPEEARRRPREGGGRKELKWDLVGRLCPPVGAEKSNGSEGPQRLLLPL